MARKPDFDVGCLDKVADIKGNVGGAWANKDGTISIVLNPFVVITGGKDRLLTLFPRETNDEIPS